MRHSDNNNWSNSIFCMKMNQLNQIEKINFSVVLILLLCLLGTLSFFVVKNANWTMGDDNMFVTSTAIGKPFPISENLRPHDGRFCPLGQQHNNLLLLFEPEGVSIESMYIRNAIELILFGVLFFFFVVSVLKCEFSFKWWHLWIALFAVIFVIERLYTKHYLTIIYGGGFHPLLNLLFLWSSYNWYKSKKNIYAVLSILSAIYSTYTSEPRFGTLLVFATIPLLFGWKTLDSKLRNYSIVLIFNSLLFLIIYYFVIYRHIVSVYSPNNIDEVTIWTCLYTCLMSHKILFITIPIACIRVYALFIKKDHEHLFFDAVLFMGLAGCVANAILKLNTGHYYAMSICSMTLPTIFYLIYYVKELTTTVILGLLAAFYLTKYPKDIIANQEIRQHDWPIIEQIAQQAGNGEEIYVYRPIELYDRMPKWDKIFYDYYNLVLQNMIRMHIDDQDFVLTEIEKSNDIKTDGFVLVSNYIIDGYSFDMEGTVKIEFELSNMNIYHYSKLNHEHPIQ